MFDSGPILSHKPLLGHGATCVPTLAIEACALQLGNHAENLRLPDMVQNSSTKS